jgi:hypothetical protein
MSLFYALAEGFNRVGHGVIIVRKMVATTGEFMLLIPRSVPSFSPSIMAYKSKLCFLSFYQNVL